MITASEALHHIAEAPGITFGRLDGNRKKARALASKREAEKLRIYERLLLAAAGECERRKAATVGEAIKPRIVRLARRALLLDLRRSA